jgi:hypothetical protein
LNTQSTTSDRTHSPQLFHIIHPFHPLYGETFELVQIRSNWGEERAYYVDAHEQLKTLPLGWTSLAAPDPFVTMAAGRAAFRLVDLLALVHLIREIAK